MINVEEDLFLCIDPDSGDVVKDSLTNVYIFFPKLPSTIHINLYKELKLFKQQTHPNDCWYLLHDQMA